MRQWNFIWKDDAVKLYKYTALYSAIHKHISSLSVGPDVTQFIVQIWHTGIFDSNTNLNYDTAQRYLTVRMIEHGVNPQHNSQHGTHHIQFKSTQVWVLVAARARSTPTLPHTSTSAASALPPLLWRPPSTRRWTRIPCCYLDFQTSGSSFGWGEESYGEKTEERDPSSDFQIVWRSFLQPWLESS